MSSYLTASAVSIYYTCICTALQSSDMNGSLVSPNNTISKAECSNGSKKEKPTRTTCDCHQNETVKQQSNWKPQLKLIIACMLTLSFMIAKIIGMKNT